MAVAMCSEIPPHHPPAQTGTVKGLPGGGNATYPATLTVGTADPGKGTHLLIILSLYRLIDRRCSSPSELVLAYRGRPPVGRP